MDLIEDKNKLVEVRWQEVLGYTGGVVPVFIPIDKYIDETEVVMYGKRVIMVGSNNYLGLTTDRRVKEVAKKAIDEWGTGCTGSRFLNGTLVLHREVEEKLADFMGKEDCAIFGTGYQTNVGVLSTLGASRSDIFIMDKECHASIYDGVKMSNARVFRYKHNNMSDLERVLRRLSSDKNKLIITDGVFSMGGDLPDLRRLVELKEEYNAYLMVDDAHGIGVLGEDGAGTVSHFGLTDKVDVIIGTFSKSFATLGGFVVSDKYTIRLIKSFSRAFMFSASVPPANLAIVSKIIDIIREEPERRKRLLDIAEFMRKSFIEMGYKILHTETPIIPIFIGDEELMFKVWRELFELGVYANPVTPPAVPRNACLIRTSYMATHKDEQLERVLEAFRKVDKKFGITESKEYENIENHLRKRRDED
jgi:8-amino-7-oxononanoate synthase